MSADATQRAPQGRTLSAAPGSAGLARRAWPWLVAIVAALLLPFLLLVLILVFKPRGLMGTRDT